MAAAADNDVEDLADLYEVHQSTRGTTHVKVGRLITRRLQRRGLVTKATAAKKLGVSLPTLSKWIARGKIRTRIDPASGVERVEALSLAQTLVYVRRVRETGETDGVLAAAIHQLEQQDPHFQSEFDALYGESLRALQAGDLKPLAIPASFRPDD